jgi:O-phospho-L-seryl-tRNASec:L-selenocysteinyl-tRNA synthase
VAPTLSFDSSAAAASNNQQQQQRKQYVVWSRIDQKTCLKSITAANLTPIVIELIQQGDELATDVEGIRAAVQRVGAQCVAAVVTTTSCFAPR